MDWSLVTDAFKSISTDWIIPASLAMFFAFDALRAGPARVTALSIALPMALALSKLLSATAFIGTYVPAGSAGIEAGACIALSIGLFIVFYRIADSGADTLHPLAALLAGVASAGIVFCTILQIPDGILPWKPGDVLGTVFGDAYRLFWMIGGYLALAVVRR